MQLSDAIENSKNRKFLITGSSGVIGRAIIDILPSEAQIVAIDRKEPSFSLPTNVEFSNVDLLHEGAPLIDHLRNVEIVFHLAARMPQAKLTQEEFYQANVSVTKRLFDASAQMGVKRFVFASTIEVYGVQPVDQALSEKDSLVFTGHYSKNKFESEQNLLQAGKEIGIETVALRMPMIFGPGFYHEKSMILLFCAVKLGLPVPLPVSDAPVAFVSSRDTASAFLQAAFSEGVDGEAFNITAPDNPEMREFFEQVISLAGSRSRTIVARRSWVERLVAAAQRRANGPNDKVPILGTPAELVPYILTGGRYSIEKAKRTLDFEPQDSCSQAWASAYNWYWSQPVRDKYRVTVKERV